MADKFDKFKKSWSITSTANNPKCGTSCSITIAGTKTNVTITCSAGHSYGSNGSHDDGTDKISNGTYTISYNADDTITCNNAPTVFGGGVTASWTANDSGPGGGDE